MEEMQLAYEALCCATQHQLAATPDDYALWAAQTAKLLAQEAEAIWQSGQQPKRLNSNITKAYAIKFTEALSQGYGTSLAAIDYNTPDADMLQNLLTNVYQFSAAKNHAQMVQLTRALVTGDGKLRSWSQFKQAAYTINDAHVQHWMKAEYNTAIASAQMASRWVAIQTHKESLPLLQFDAVNDNRTSDLCRSLNGVIKPADDPFWNTYYPPNHFGCRSDVRQLSSGTITPDHAIVHPEKIPAMFKTNLAKTGLLWPKDHPYWVGIPPSNNSHSQAVTSKEIQQWAKYNMRDKSFELPGGDTAVVSGDAIKELLHKPHEFKQDRNLLLYNLQSVLNNSQLVFVGPDIKGNPFVKEWRYYKFLLNGKNSYINVKVVEDGRKILYAITDHLK